MLLEVGEKLSHNNQGVVGLGPLDFVDPNVYNSAEDEFPRFAFHSFISDEVADVGLVDGLIPCSHKSLFVFPDGRIVHGRFWGER